MKTLLHLHLFRISSSWKKDFATKIELELWYVILISVATCHYSFYVRPHLGKKKPTNIISEQKIEDIFTSLDTYCNIT